MATLKSRQTGELLYAKEVPLIAGRDYGVSGPDTLTPPAPQVNGHFSVTNLGGGAVDITGLSSVADLGQKLSWAANVAGTAWVEVASSKALKTTSLTPVRWSGVSFVDAQADAGANVAEQIQLSDGSFVSADYVRWDAHGLNVGSTYYLDQSTLGGYTDTVPTAGIVQRLFQVVDADTINVSIQEAYSADDGVWRNQSDDSPATNASSDIQYDGGLLRIGAYAADNNAVLTTPYVFVEDPANDGLLKKISLEALGNLLGVIPRPITISGYVITGQTLSVLDYGGAGSPSDSHQWLSGGSPLIGQTGTTLVVTPSMEGSTIELKVNGELSNLLKNFYPIDVGAQVWVDGASDIGAGLVNRGTGGMFNLTSGTTQPVTSINGVTASQLSGQRYNMPNPFGSDYANTFTFIGTWTENIASNNFILNFNGAETGGTGGDLNSRASAHIPWSNRNVYFDLAGTTVPRLQSTSIGPVGQSFITSYQGTPTGKIARIFRSGSVNPTPGNFYEQTTTDTNPTTVAGGVEFGQGVNDHAVGDLIAINADISQTALFKLEAYTAWKYGLQDALSTDHPYKSGPA